jgi:hypothetical protein
MMNNQLKDVPVEIGQLNSLTQFDYAGNQFSYETQQKIINLMAPTPVKPTKSRAYKKSVSRNKKTSKRKQYSRKK